MNASKRNGTIDLLRFVFSMVIIVYHGRNLGNSSNAALFKDAGYIAVEFFFIVSGFLMAKSAARNQSTHNSHLGIETIQFIWHKIKPILPYYLLATVCSYTCIIIANSFSFLEALRNLMLGVWNLLFLGASGIKSYTLVRATWYLSVMFLSMFILYPMLRKWGETFTHIIAPLISVFLLGYLSQTYGNLNQYTNNFQLVYSGMLRGIAELCLGCVCYVVYERLNALRFSHFSRIILSLIQIIGYSGIIYCTTDLPAKQFDFVLLLCLAVCTTLSFSGQGIASSLFQGRLFSWLGKISMIMYLNHMWIKDSIAHWLPSEWGYTKLLGFYIVSVILFSTFAKFMVEKITHWATKHRSAIKRIFLSS